MFLFKAGSTGKTIYVMLVDSSTFLPKTGLLFSDLTIQTIAAAAAAAGVTEATLAAANSAWSSGGFKEVDATNSPGLYRFDIPDAALATGPFVIVTFKAAGVKTEALLVQLVAYDPYDATALGLSRLDAAITSRLASGSYSAPLDASGVRGAVGLASANLDTQLGNINTAAGAVKTKTDQLTFTKTNEIDANVQSINGVTVNGDGSTTPFGP